MVVVGRGGKGLVLVLACARQYVSFFFHHGVIVYQRGRNISISMHTTVTRGEGTQEIRNIVGEALEKK